MSTTCVVFMCNYRYFPKFIESCRQLIEIGKYSGPICLIVPDDLVGKDCLNNPFLTQHNIIVKHFPDIVFPSSYINTIRKIRPQWKFELSFIHAQKNHIFNVFFKQWDYILYMDTGAGFFKPIQPLLDTKLPGVYLAHSNAYPSYRITLKDEFADVSPYIQKLKNTYGDLNIDYPQATMALFDTNLITESTFDDLYNLTLEYPNALQNDQTIIALYFVRIRNVWKQIPLGNDTTFYYDWAPRWGRPKSDYIVLKYPDFKS